MPRFRGIFVIMRSKRAMIYIKILTFAAPYKTTGLFYVIQY